jgi:KRAB domain-containing zinc finger protein
MTLVHTSSSGEWVCGIGACKVLPPNTWSKKDYLLGHVRLFHDRVTYTCDECGKSYRDWKRHKKYHTAEPKDILTCFYCDFFTLSNQTLRFHKKMEHPTKGGKKYIQGKLSCDSCSFTTTGLSHTPELEAMRLIIHKKIHREGNIVCDKCMFTTKRNFSFQRHLSDEHKLGERYDCTICDYSTGGYSGKSHLKLHMETHNKEKSFMCDKCEYKSSSQRSLKEHLQRHEDTKRFLCDGCDYKTNNYPNFLAHKRTKHGETMSCDDCDFTTKSDRTMRNHKYKHSTSLVCGDCDFRTNSMTALRYHKTSKSHGTKI